MRRIHRDVVPLDVVTPFGYYDEMLITEVTGRRVGNGLRFRMKLENIIRVGLVPRQIQEPTSSGPALGRDTELPLGRVEPDIIAGPVDFPEPPTAPGLAEAVADSQEAIQVSASPAVSRSMASRFADFNDFAGLPAPPAFQSLIPSHGSPVERIDALARRLKGTQSETRRRILQIKSAEQLSAGRLGSGRQLPGVNSSLDILEGFRRPRLF